MKIGDLKGGDDRTRNITTPSGLEVKVRRVTVADFITVGHIPMSLFERMANDPQAFQRELSEDNDLAIKTMNTILVAGILPDENGFRFVSARPEDCEDKEVSIHDMDSTDFFYLVTEIYQFSNLDGGGEEVAESLDNFRDGLGVDNTPDGEDVQSDASGSVEDAPGGVLDEHEADAEGDGGGASASGDRSKEE